jgi:hypothetical protein
MNCVHLSEVLTFRYSKNSTTETNMSGLLEPRLCRSCAKRSQNGADYDCPELVKEFALAAVRREETEVCRPAPPPSPFRDPTQDVSRREGPPKRGSPKRSVAGSRVAGGGCCYCLGYVRSTRKNKRKHPLVLSCSVCAIDKLHLDSYLPVKTETADGMNRRSNMSGPLLQYDAS